MSFSDDDDEFDSLLPLPDVDFAALDLSSYTVLPSQAASRPPPLRVVKQEHHRNRPAEDEEMDFPIRVNEHDGTYGLRVSPAKGAAPPAVTGARPPAPAPPSAMLPPPAPARQQYQQQDVFPASQQQIPLSQAAAARRAAVFGSAVPGSSSGDARGQSAPPGQHQPARPVGGFSQRPLGPPLQSQQQRATSAAPVGARVNPFAYPQQRSTSRGAPVPPPPHARTAGLGASPGPRPAAGAADGRSGTEIVDFDMEELKRQNESLVKALKEKEDAYYTAHGEASMLRRRMEEAERRNKEAIDALMAQQEAAEEKRRKKDEERRSEEEARRAKAMLDNHNAATFSIRRPTAVPPSSTSWATQSVSRPKHRHPSTQNPYLPLSSSQRRYGGGLFGQPVQTPAPIGKSAGREFVLRHTGASRSGSGGRSVEKGSPKGKERAGPSPRAPTSASKARSGHAHVKPPPVPKFPTLHNSFALGASGAAASANASRRASSANLGLGGKFKSAAAEDRGDEVERELKKRRVTGGDGHELQQDNADDYGGGMDVVGGDPDGRHTVNIPPLHVELGEVGGVENEGGSTPKASQRVLQPGTSSPVPDSDGVDAMDVDVEENIIPEEEEEEPNDDDEEYWRVETKDILLAVLFNHQIDPLSPAALPMTAPGATQLSAPSPSTPSSAPTKNPTIQAILAPLDPAGPASTRDRTEHARASSRILGALGGAGQVVAGSSRAAVAVVDVVVAEVLKGLQAMAKLFERLSLMSLLTNTLLLIRSLILHIPHAGQALLRLPSLISLVSSIKDHHLPSAPPSSKGKGRTLASAIVTERSEGEDGRGAKIRVTRAMLNVLEAVVWQADGQMDADILSNLVQLPKLVSSLLDAAAQPPDVVAQTVRILKLLSFFESLFRPLLAYTDQPAQGRGRDATRIPIVDHLCKLLRDPPSQASSSESLAMSLDIIDIFRTLCYKHQEDAVLLFSQQRALTPTLVFCLEQCSSAVWGVDPIIDDMRRSIPPLVPILRLLSLLTSPEESALAPTLKLADRLRSAPKSDFPAAFETFMVAFGRICYAEVPDLEDLAAWEDSDEVEGRETWRMWESELERAGDIARDIFDQVVEGPEGDLVYGVFVLEPDEETESLASSAAHGGVGQHPQDDDQGAPPPSSQPLGPLMPEHEEAGGGPGPGRDDEESETEEDEPAKALPTPSRSGAGSTSQQRRSGRIKSRAVPRQEVVLPKVRHPVEVVDLMSSDED